MRKHDANKLTVGEKATYSLGALGREVSAGMISTYFMLYLTVFVGLNGIVVGIAFCLAKIWDAVNDPILASFISKTRSKYGQYRPWMLIGMLTNSIILVLMFLPIGGGVGVKYFYYILMYVLWGMSFTLVDVPYWSMIPTLASTTDERNSVSSLSRLIGGFGGFIIGSGGSVLIGLTYGKENVWSYFVVACLAGVLLCGMLSATLLHNRERVPIVQEPVKLREIIGIFKDNDQLRVYAITFVLFAIGTAISLSQIIYLFIYDQTHLDFEKHFIIFNVVSCAGQGIVMIFYPLIAKKIPREKLYGGAYLMAIMGMGLLFGLFFVLGGNRFANVIIISFAGALLMIANGLNQIGSTVMIADIVDYGEYKTGKRRDAVMFSVQTLLYKVAAAFALLVLGMATYISKLPTIDLLTNTFEGEVTNKMLVILRGFMFLLPIPFVALGAVIYKKRYYLYGDKYAKIKEELDARYAAKAEQEEVASDEEPILADGEPIIEDVEPSSN